MLKGRVTLPCGCGCGDNISPRTPRKLATDLRKSLSGNLFKNKSHFARWNHLNQLQLKREKETEDWWNEIPCASDKYSDEVIKRALGNIADLNFSDSILVGGHSAPPNSIFRGNTTKDKEIGMTEEEQLRQRLAEIEADKAKATAPTKKVSPAELGTRQDLGSNTISGNPITARFNQLFPNNVVVCKCQNPPITITPKVQSTGVWMLNDQGEKEYLDSPIPSCTMFMGERSFMTVLGNNDEYDTNPDDIGRYVKAILPEESPYVDPHCYYCSEPIYDGIRGTNPKTGKPQPKHWINTGVMTEIQLAWTYQTREGPGGTNPTFHGTVEEYVDSFRTSSTTPSATQMELSPSQNEATTSDEVNDSDLPPM